jgi:catechol 2,3-dioxygenase-like lactoylglutathione lyase family enzyme
MLKRAAMSALIVAAILGAPPPASAQSDGDLSGSRAMAFVGATDLQRARQFYGQVLGLRIIGGDDSAVLADAGGVRVRITRQAQVTPAAYTVLGFEVADIYTITQRLAARGVKFVRLPALSPPQDGAGMWTAPNGDKEVWLKDPDGNLLTLSNGVSGR